MDWVIEQVVRYPRRASTVLVMVLLVAGAAAWWFLIWQNPRQAFEDMLANNLAATSVTKHVHADSAGLNIEQTVRLQMGSTNAAEWLVSRQQGSSSFIVDQIGTPDAGYIRYLKISTTQKNSRNNTYDFSSVLNTWGKADSASGSSLNSLFDETIIDIANATTLPIGNLPAERRDNILHYMRSEQIFTPDYAKVKKETIDGRGVYTYPVAVKLGAYIRMMQAFAHDLGINSLDNVDPSQYSTLPPITMSVSVDRNSHMLARVSYANTGFTEAYSDWGILTPIKAPTSYITTTELQKRIQSLSSQ